MALHPEQPLNLISLCIGGGGLDRAVELALPSARSILLVERESFSAANLVAQIEEGVLAPAAVWSDARTVPGRRFRGLVDGVIGGIPCQPYSVAGKRLGRDDPRDLWGAARRCFVQSGAWFILIENVGGMLSEGGAERVRGDLLRLGCEIEGGLFRASEVGFPHERERLFILGVADARCTGRSEVARSAPRHEGAYAGRPAEHDHVAQCGGQGLADADLSELQRQPPAGEQPPLQQDHGTGGRAVVHPLRRGHDGRSQGPERDAERRAAVEWAEHGPLFPPGPGDAESWRRIAQFAPERLPAVSRHDLFQIEIRAARLAAHGDPQARPRQVWGDTPPSAWLDPAGPYGLCASVVQAIAQSTLRRGSDGLASRIDELRMLGNGVVPLCGAYAFRTLAARLALRSPAASELIRRMGLEA